MPTSRPLPSWNDGPARAAILDFVGAAVDPASPGYLRPADRIAVFAHDGTLWCEYPLAIEAQFIGARLIQLARQDPALRQRQPFKAFLDEDLPKIHGLGFRAILQLGFVTHAGITMDDFTRRATAWIATAMHPALERPVGECTYLPQLELLAFLRRHGFATFVVTGGAVNFVRAFAPDAYGVPAHHVIGSSVKLQVDLHDDVAELVKLAEPNSFNDGEAKVRNIALHLGLRPVFAFGNSDHDLAMLRYTAGGRGPRLALLLHHDDGAREFAYDREFYLNPLDEALDRAAAFGIQVVSMRQDWAAVFSERGAPAPIPDGRP